MTAAMVGPGREHGHRMWDYLVRTWQELDVPEGWRAEIDEGNITLVPPPTAEHNFITGAVHSALFRCLPEGMGIYRTLGVFIAPLEKVYVPDLVVIESSLLTSGEDDDIGSLDAADALLMVEVTSRSKARDDRTKRLRAYAHAPVPLHLLIDRWHEGGATVTLYSHPSGGAYQSSVQVPFGKPVELPEPFGTALDTSAYPR
ncbi:Uma2 family endonuclease [Streptomyces pactum]|uniref:Uma2 family endonuclease n=1 Tax=Streptomyces pactum TaxID=68249 RepID=A0ABS0NMG9_9ACTN|nr:Uma2 family endonuclease [Streptomyces pactum]MBH5336361.1 Uma2 family endonuclease [Streptomyces pactum]